ncbi:MAG: calcium-translocating P-type ATPase, PMCA-type [Methanosphaera sp.]|nr:calcium-translocating P-type ATPase, PMCA-type [Methanosphaera sp.]
MDIEKLTPSEILDKLDTSIDGLTSSQVEAKTSEYGKNQLKEKPKKSNIRKFLEQFTEPMTVLLIIAGIIALLIEDYIDSGVIFLIVIFNAVMGYRQENQAENAMDKLKSLTSKKAIVLRDNTKCEVNTEDITIGDIVILEEGDNIPADIRLIETYDLKIDESSLTGESLPVEKIADPVDDDSHDNIVYMNSFVSRGRAKGVVYAIGMDTQIGNIASMIQEEDDKLTPLGVQMDKVGKILGSLAIVVCIIVIVLETVQGVALADSFMTAVSLAVAAIPEGLPAVLTLTLTLGMQRMANNNAIVRKLLAVETLGSCSVVCSDKTGTLTQNKLTVTDSSITDEKMSYIISGLCNNAKVTKDTKIGDPTDISVMEYAIENNFDSDITYERLYEIPLDSQRKRMTTINTVNKKEYVLIKGAAEILLDKCEYISHNGTTKKITDKEKNSIQDEITDFTNRALRVLLLAYKEVDDYTKYSQEQLESNLVYTGIIGMMDPPREGVKESIQQCYDAGIDVKMITGDHKNTASAIAQKIGIRNNENTLTGNQMKEMDDDQLRKVVMHTNVFARVFPEQKVRIVKALQSNNQTVSMTGDGVNDAPALTSANIGVAMGSSTDVAKDSSDMILQDDKFSTIIYAVKEGRTIYSNIKRFIKFQLSTNIAAIITVLSATLMSIQVPFNAVQLLWINIIMDGPPAQSLGVEPSDENIMNVEPSDENILAKDNLTHIILIGIVMAIGTLGLYLYELSIGTDTTLATTIAFTVFVMYQLFNVFNCRSKSNKRNNTLIASVILSFILQLCVIYISPLQTIFRTTAIPLISWIPIIIVALTVLVAERIIRRFENSII